MSEQSKIEDRRQRAREAFYDTPGCVADPDTALTDAIETATRVKITDAALALMDPATGNREARLRAALAELGFEVES